MTRPGGSGEGGRVYRAIGWRAFDSNAYVRKMKLDDGYLGDDRSRATFLDAPRVAHVAGLGLDLGLLRRVGVHARVRRVAGLTLDRGNDLRVGLKSEGGGDRSSGSRASLAAVLALASLPPVLADARAPALLALVSPPPVLADARAPALLALASLPPVLTDARAPALLAFASHPPVLAEARAPALLALASHPPVLADLRAPALLARASLPPMLADARAPALLAAVSLPPVLAEARPPRTPYTSFAPSRARRSPSPGTPCKSTLPCPSRAGTTDLAVPSPPPSAFACQDSSACRRAFARSVVLAERNDESTAGLSVLFSSDPTTHDPNARFFPRPRVSPTHAPARRCDALGRALPRCGVVAAPW
jgi:hypothetical protein